MRIENWIEVTAAIDEYRSKPYGYFSTIKEANDANITGWYGASPIYNVVQVLVDGDKIYKLNKIKRGRT